VNIKDVSPTSFGTSVLSSEGIESQLQNRLPMIRYYLGLQCSTACSNSGDVTDYRTL